MKLLAIVGVLVALSALGLVGWCIWWLGREDKKLQREYEESLSKPSV